MAHVKYVPLEQEPMHADNREAIQTTSPSDHSLETRFYLTSLVLLALALSMSANLLQYTSVLSKQYDETYSMNISFLL